MVARWIGLCACVRVCMRARARAAPEKRIAHAWAFQSDKWCLILRSLLMYLASARGCSSYRWLRLFHFECAFLVCFLPFCFSFAHVSIRRSLFCFSFARTRGGERCSIFVVWRPLFCRFYLCVFGVYVVVRTWRRAFFTSPWSER